ncbi:hypothetical protein [Kocuria sp.]|uniref:hypothetical protein n=1 Tax=Kocuria sp. TaxID=1871328 RepID=UPI0026E0B35B|nr:hypothetical protein [Kocuria sp.]MDO5617816.1 hypothetical protein [Kocuria sp.]
MKRDPAAGDSALRFKVQDAKGQNLLLNRDILRRTYAAIKDLANDFYLRAEPTHDSRMPQHSQLYISFTESQDGTVTFIAEQHVNTTLGQRRALLNSRRRPRAAADSTRAQRALQSTLLLARAATFALEAGGIHRCTTHNGLTDLASPVDDQLLRVPTEVADSLTMPHMQAHLREFLAALSEDGVGAIVVGSDPHSPELRSECVIPATDTLVEFQAGKRLR